MAAVPVPFDVQALYQASEMSLPSDPVEAQVLWVQNSADLAAAADEIRRLQRALFSLGGAA